MVEVKWAGPALQQLGDVLNYIALDKPEAAKRVAHRIFESTDRLKSLPFSGRKIPEFPHKQYRKLWCKPCWVYYRIDRKMIFILHVRRAESLFRTEDLLLE
jgi:plasmid stabilization system protein ParE